MRNTILLKYLMLSLIMLSIFTGCSLLKEKNSPKTSEVINEFKKGELTESTFESKYLNLEFTLPEGYIMFTEEDMLNTTNLGAELMDLEQDEIDNAKAVSVYEMVASKPEGLPNIMVMSEKLPAKNFTEEIYLDSLITQLNLVEGMNYTFSKSIEKIKIASEEYTVLEANLKINNITIIQNYYVRIYQGRAIVIILTFTNDTISEKDMLLSRFKTIL